MEVLPLGFEGLSGKSSNMLTANLNRWGTRAISSANLGLGLSVVAPGFDLALVILVPELVWILYARGDCNQFL